MITVDYKGKTLAALTSGKKATLKCANMTMEDDVVITAPESTGGGECTGKHVIELESLPQAGLVEGEVYKIKKKALLSVALHSEDITTPDLIGLMITMLGPILGIEDGTVPEGVYRYSKEIPTDVPEFEMSFCYVESENMLYVYSAEVGAWVSAAEAEDSDAPYIGAITSMDQITEYGMYALLGYEGSEFYEIVPESYKMIALLNGTPTDVSTLFPCTIVVVPTLPTENIIESIGTSFYCYYAEDQQDIFVYVSGEWNLFSQAFGLPFGGFIETMGQATEEGVAYILTNNGGLMNYFHPEGTLRITESGVYDVTKYSTVNADIPSYAIYGKRKIPLTRIPSNLDVPINFTTVYQGETVNCTRIRFEWDFMDDGVSIYYYKENGDSIYVFYDQLSAGDIREGSCLYVDFGPEPQLVVKEFADYMAQSVPLFETISIPNITFTIDGVEYSDVYAISWYEFVNKTEGFESSYSCWEDYVYKEGYVPIRYNGVNVKSYDTIINGAAYTTQ